VENCSRCETLPDNPSGTGKLFLTSPLSHTLSKIAAIFDEQDHPFEMRDDEIIYSKLTVEGLSQLSEVVRENLSQDETDDIQALWKESGNELTLSDFTEMLPLSTFLERIESQWLIEVLDEESLYNVFQPIVAAENPKEIHGYECFLRGLDREGDTIGPERLFQTAERSDLLFQLDREARIEAVENSDKLGVNRKIFINFMPTSIYDPEYCLRTTLEAVRKNDIRREQLVFEVVEPEEISDHDKLVEILNHYRQEGIGVALDDLGSGYNSLNILKELEPDYVKLDLELVQSVREHPLRAELASRLIELASSNGIMTMAEGIENESEFNWFREHGVDFLQGYYLAEPSEGTVENIDVA